MGRITLGRAAPPSARSIPPLAHPASTGCNPGILGRRPVEPAGSRLVPADQLEVLDEDHVEGWAPVS